MKSKRYSKRMVKKALITSAVIVVLAIGGTGAVIALQPDKSHPKTPSSQLVNQSQAPEADSVTQVTPQSASPVTTENQAQAQQPQAVTVSAVQQVPIDDNNTDCKLVYSDGSTFQWHWRTATKQIDYCDERIIGKVKSDTSSVGQEEADTTWQLNSFTSN